MSSIELLAPVVAALTAWFALRVLLRRRKLLLDTPNERSLHAAPIPRVGGLGLLPGVGAGWLCLPEAVAWQIWLPVAVLFVLSIVDDACDLRVSIRLAAHLAASLVVAWSIVLPAAGWPAAAGAVIAIAWMTNLYNFMDGSDGLAGGMAVIGFSTYAGAAALAGVPQFALACVVVAASASA